MSQQSLFSMKNPRTHFEFRCDDALRIVSEGRGITILMVAKRMGLSKTYVRELLLELMSRDAIHYTWKVMANGLRVMVFYPNITPANDDDDYLDNGDIPDGRNSIGGYELPLSEDPKPEDFLPF